MPAGQSNDPDENGCFYGELRGELDGAEVDPSFAPPKPALVDRPCPRFGEGSAVLIEAGRLVVARRMCPDPAELTWAPKKARRRPAKSESAEKAAAEQGAADQRLQARCAGALALSPVEPNPNFSSITSSPPGDIPAQAPQTHRQPRT